MASKPHHPQPGAAEEPAAKKARPEGPPSSKNPTAPFRVELNPADCDLDFYIEQNGLQGHALVEKGFAYCWSGARASVGITGGKYCFGCKVISEQSVDMDDTSLDQQHVCRVGISRGDDPVGNLGETLHSFGFGGTGKFSNAGKFSDYGAKFGLGDTIVCSVNLESRPFASIEFSKNGKSLGVAKQFDASSRGLGVVDTPVRNLSWESALFPHVLLKNVVVQLQFSIEEGLIPEEGYEPWSSALEDGKAIIGPTFSNPKECEVLMMVGLPASGKTTWAEKWVKEHPEKRYVLLGTNLALDQMKVPGLLRKHNYGERFDRLMDRATGIFNTLLARAAKTPRNYILDQTNVYRSARKRKLKAFVKYRKIAVVTFPTPDELKLRADKRFKEMGKEVPAEAVNEMLANYALPLSKDIPGSNEYFDEVVFPELTREEAERHLAEMKRSLASPNLNSKREFSPYSRETSVQSFSSPPVQKKEAASVAGGHWSASRSPAILPNRDILNPLQVSPAYYSRSGSYGDPRTNLGDAIIPAPSNSPYGYSTYRDEPDPYGRYSGSDPYRRSASERNPIPMGDMNQYRQYGATDAFRNPISDFESPSSRWLGVGYSSHVAARGPKFEAALEPRYEWRSPLQSTYGGSPSYHSPNPHLRGPGAFQVDRRDARETSYELHGTPQNTYGALPYTTPPPRPPSGFRPPMGDPHGSWYH